MESIAEVILVNEADQPIGTAEKLSAHQTGQLHRAFSIFVLRKRNNAWQVLIQQRQHNKYHSGGLWTNTCCSHPRPGEEIITAGKRRLREEMGFECDLIEIGSFIYKAQLDNNLVEHEFDHVLIGYFDQDMFDPNPEEVADYRWQDLASLQQDVKANPQHYTAWFAEALSHLEVNIEALR